MRRRHDRGAVGYRAEYSADARAQAVFAGLIAMWSAWAVFAGWVLSGRRPLFALHRVPAARIALAATVVTALAGVALAAVRSAVPPT